MNDSDALLDAIWAQLDKTGVYVHPSMPEQFTPSADQLAQIEANVTRSTDPIYVVVYPLDPDDEFNGDPANLAAVLHDHRSEPGYYLTTDTRWPESRLELGGASWETTSTDDWAVDHAAFVAQERHPKDLGDQLVTATTLLAEQTTRAEYDKAYAESREDRESSTSSNPFAPSPYGDEGISTTTLLIVGVALVVGVALLWRKIRNKRKQPGTFALPASVSARVRDAHDSALVTRVDRELLALGELIDDTELTGSSAAWQSALDHYDAAKRARGDDERPDVLDVVGALVLVERGTAALDAATRGRKSYKPSRPCYLNPLHGDTTSDTQLQTPSGKVTVPLCAQCRRDLSAQRTPDILDVVRDGKPVHYFDSGVEPWASTGYGALDPNLVQRLHQTRRR